VTTHGPNWVKQVVGGEENKSRGGGEEKAPYEKKERFIKLTVLRLGVEGLADEGLGEKKKNRSIPRRKGYQALAGQP